MKKLFYFLLLIPLIGLSQDNEIRYNPVGYTSHKGIKIPTNTAEITTATKVLVLDSNGIFRLSKPNIGITALDTLTVNPYFGIRLKPKDASVSGFHIEKNINGLVGYSVKNEDETGNGSNSGYTARGLGTNQYDNFVGLYHYNGNYGISSLRNTGAITSDRIVSIWNYGANAPYIDFLTGETLMSPTSKLRIFQNGQLKLGVQPTLATNNDDLVSINSTGNITKTKKIELQETDNAETLYFSGENSSDIAGAKRLYYKKIPSYSNVDYLNVAHNTILEEYVLEAGDLDNFIINDGIITFNFVIAKYYNSANDTNVTFQAELYENSTSTSPFAVSELSEVLGIDYSFEGKLKARVLKKYIATGQRLMVKIRVFYANTTITQDFVTTHGSNLGTDNTNLSMFELPINRKHHISQTIANDITALVPSVDAVYDFVKSEITNTPTPTATVSAGTETFFFTGETDVSGVKSLNPTKQPSASQISSFLNDVQNNVVEETYVFKLDNGHPHYIPKGTGEIFFKAVKTAGDKNVKLKFRLRKFKDGVINETFATSEESAVITTSDADYKVTFPILNNIIIDAQNEETIRIDVIPTNTTGTTTTDIVIKMMGTTGTRLVIPTDDTSPITQDLALGLNNVAPSSNTVKQALDLKQDKPTMGKFALNKDLVGYEHFFFSSSVFSGTGRYVASYNSIEDATVPLEKTAVTNGQVVYEMSANTQDYSNRTIPESYVTTKLRASVTNTGTKKLEIYCEVYEVNALGNLTLLSSEPEKAEISGSVSYHSFSSKVINEFIETNHSLVFKYVAVVTGTGNDPNLRILVGNSQGSRVMVGSDRATGISKVYSQLDKNIAASPFQVNAAIEGKVAEFRTVDRYGINNFQIAANVDKKSVWRDLNTNKRYLPILNTTTNVWEWRPIVD